MRAHHARLMRDRKRAQNLYRRLEHFIVALAAHHHANQRLFVHTPDYTSAPKRNRGPCSTPRSRINADATPPLPLQSLPTTRSLPPQSPWPVASFVRADPCAAPSRRCARHSHRPSNWQSAFSARSSHSAPAPRIHSSSASANPIYLPLALKPAVQDPTGKLINKAVEN